MKFYDVTKQDLDGIVSQMRLTKGVEVAVFIYEVEPEIFKVSLRSNNYVDVAEIAAHFDGGGHVLQASGVIRGSIRSGFPACRTTRR